MFVWILPRSVSWFHVQDQHRQHSRRRPDSAEAVVIESRETRTYLRTARRTAFIRILDEYDLDVVNFRAFAAGSAGVGEIVDGVGEVAAGKNALLAAFWRLRRRRRWATTAVKIRSRGWTLWRYMVFLRRSLEQTKFRYLCSEKVNCLLPGQYTLASSSS